MKASIAKELHNTDNLLLLGLFGIGSVWAIVQGLAFQFGPNAEWIQLTASMAL